MTGTNKHRVIYWALKNGVMAFDDNHTSIVERTIETDDLDHAVRLHREVVLATGCFGAATLVPAVDTFAEDDLAGYLRALNTEARLAQEFPQKGTWIGALTENLGTWAATGITTPQQLGAYLDAEAERELS